MKSELKKTLFYCITYYQAYISVLKVLAQNIENPDIILSDVIPDYEQLKKHLDQTKIFQKVYLYEEKNVAREIRNQFHQKRDNLTKIQQVLFSKILWIKCQNEITEFAADHLPLDIKQYDTIYVFGQGRTFAPYLFKQRKHYILVEDSLNYYQIGVNSFVDANRMPRPRPFYIVNRLLDCLGVYYYMGGYSHVEDAIEVNDKNQTVFIRSAKKKIREVPRKELLNCLSDNQKQLIYNSFSALPVSVFQLDKTMDIILTNPFMDDHIVESQEKMRKIYTKLIKQECIGTECIIIKPHPRDLTDYHELDTAWNIHIIEKNLPIEILNLMFYQLFRKAIAIDSTAIPQADYAKIKINLGMKWLESIRY